jgi:predicted DNA-binding ribbon-helix-helix protein
MTVVEIRPELRKVTQSQPVQNLEPQHFRRLVAGAHEPAKEFQSMSSDSLSSKEDSDYALIDEDRVDRTGDGRDRIRRITADNKMSTLVSRNVTVGGHRTSCRLEPYMWDALYDVCSRERITIHALCTMIDERKDPNTSLTAAIRVFALAYFRAAATEEGHSRVQHGLGQPFTNTPFPDRAESENEAAAPPDRRRRGRD